MGSFNVKCAVTQMPILWGDDVVMIMLNRVNDEEYKNRMFETDQGWVVCGHAIEGTYDDYGYVEPKDPIVVEMYKNILKEEGIFSCSDKDSSYQIMIIHKGVYDNIIDSFINARHSFSDKHSQFIYGMGREKYEKYKSAFEDDTMSESDKMFLLHSRDFNKGFSSHYYKNPYLYNIIGTKDAHEANILSKQYEMDYYNTIFPIIEAASDLGYAIRPNFYASQTADPVEIFNWKDELNKIVRDADMEKQEID